MVYLCFYAKILLTKPWFCSLSHVREEHAHFLMPNGCAISSSLQGQWVQLQFSMEEFKLKYNLKLIKTIFQTYYLFPMFTLHMHVIASYIRTEIDLNLAILLDFSPIMPAFCLLLSYSYYSNNFAGEIDGSLNDNP